MKPDLAALKQALSHSGAGSSDFDLNPDVVLPEGRVLKPAGVLIPVEDGPDGPSVILTKRAAHLKHHPGQVAFPGGRQEESDGDATAAAVREANEEIGLPPDHVAILGQLPVHETVTSYAMTPVVGFVERPFVDQPEPGEVSEIFRVPLAHVTNPANFRVEGRRWQGRRRLYYAVPYGPYYIWGATARILRTLADRMSDDHTHR